MADQTAPMKLVMMIVSDHDADELMSALVEHGAPATKVGSSGGFLRRGNVTIFSGVPESQVDTVLDIVNEICPARTELVPVQTLPFIGDSAFATEPIEVRAGGATVFVLDVERFQRI
ncbi:MAG: cyclic-di-AMP receptor [Dehalococcoidia bacterium]